MGSGIYTIHPAVPWFFKNLFDAYYAGCAPGAPEADPGSDSPQAGRPMRAFVEATGNLGNYCQDQYNAGDRDVINALAAEEANLLHARRLARQNAWWTAVISTMRGLHPLYDHTGRRAEWKALVDEIVADFVDPATDGPLPGREDDEWSIVTHYRVLLAEEVRDWAKAERLQRVSVDRDRRSAEDVLSRQTSRAQLPDIIDETGTEDSGHPRTPRDQSPPFRDRLAAVLPSLSNTDRSIILDLAVSLHELGRIQFNREEPECLASFEEPLDLTEQIGDRARAAVCASSLGDAYVTIPTIRNLDQAHRWFRRSLELHDERDLLGRAICQNSLGTVALERFRAARDAGEPVATLHVHHNAALAAFLEALELVPKDVVDSLVVTHNQLAATYGEAGDFDRALLHYRESIRLSEQSGNTFRAAQVRYNAAINLALSGRFVDARDYALAALNGLATFGAAAADMVQKTQVLIKRIDADIAMKKG
jgi:tetratricopeptide (TPR) repeat protein